MTDYAKNSQALRDTERASAELREALTAGAPAGTLAELAAVHAAAEERVLVLRGKGTSK